MNRVSRVFLGISVATLAVVAMPSLALAGATKVVETSAFKVTVPTSWTVEPVRVEAGGKLGKWVVRGENSKLYVRIGNAVIMSMKEMFNKFVGESLAEHITHIEVESYDEKMFPQGNIAFGTLYGLSKRKANGHLFKFGVMVVVDHGRNRVIYASLGGTKEGWGKRSGQLHEIVGSIDLK
jgi:hypothetical protein